MPLHWNVFQKLPMNFYLLNIAVLSVPTHSLLVCNKWPYLPPIISEALSTPGCSFTILPHSSFPQPSWFFFLQLPSPSPDGHSLYLRLLLVLYPVPWLPLTWMFWLLLAHTCTLDLMFTATLTFLITSSTFLPVLSCQHCKSNLLKQNSLFTNSKLIWLCSLSCWWYPECSHLQFLPLLPPTFSHSEEQQLYIQIFFPSPHFQSHTTGLHYLWPPQPWGLHNSKINISPTLQGTSTN